MLLSLSFMFSKAIRSASGNESDPCRSGGPRSLTGRLAAVREETSSLLGGPPVASYGKMASLVTTETLESAMVAKRYSTSSGRGFRERI
jgi:hypothetical protein